MIKKIESKDNSIIKLCIKLQSKKHRDKEELYLIEGPNLIAEAIKNDVKIKTLLLSEDFDLKAEGIDNLLQSKEFKNSYAGNEIYCLGERLFSKISLTETPQGIMAIVEKQKVSLSSFESQHCTSNQHTLESKHCTSNQQAAGCKVKSNNGNFLVLDKLQDPGNIGTMIRTADAAGFGAVILLKGSGDAYSPKVVRAAAGSLFRIPIFYVEDYKQLEELLKKTGKRLIATGFDTDRFYYDVDMKENAAIAIGNEGNGISQELFDMADVVVKIPMQGNIESLNAAVSAGILMYEAMRP